MAENNNKEKTCAYEIKNSPGFEDYKCTRHVWVDGGPDEKFCLFHSEQEGKKKEAFKREIDLFKEGNPTEYLLGGKKNAISYYDFIGFCFPQGCSDFSNHDFDKPVSFNKTTFSGHAEFDRTTFYGDAGFPGAIFSGDARFVGATFDGHASFFVITFSRGADFTDVTFNGEAYFTGATFSRGAWFLGVTCKGGAWFPRTTFSGGQFFFDVLSSNSSLDLTRSLIKGDIFIKILPAKERLPSSLSISAAEIMGNLSITNSEIRRISADNLTHRRGLTLRNIVFRNDNLNEPSTLSNVCLERARFINVDLSTVALDGPFIREIVFDRISFGKPTTRGWRWSSRFWGRPNEAIHEERYARYFPKGNKKDKFCAAETVYRTLKHEMEKQHARGLARRMRAGELECKLHGDSNLIEKILLFIYRFFNGFGLRWIRALVFWLISILIFGLIYMDQTAVFKINDEEKKAYVNETVDLNLEQAVRHSVETSLAILPTKYNLDNTSIDYIEGMQRLICPLLLAAFILAVRNTATD